MRRVVEYATDALLGLDSLLLVPLRALQQLLPAHELPLLVGRQVVYLEEPADPEPDLGLAPRTALETLLANALEVGGPVLEDSLEQLLVLLLRPVVALLHVEVLEVERAVLEDDVLRVLVRETLTHGDDVAALGEVQLVAGRTQSLV